MKTLGILGGMGPMATACFMERITAMTAADTDQEQIPVIVYSNTQIPDRSAYLLGRPQASQSRFIAGPNKIWLAIPPALKCLRNEVV